MPPRKTAQAAQTASPARSTRTPRPKQGRDDTEDWERESMTSATSFKIPNPRGSRKDPNLYLQDTSVQIAAAFNAAQNAQHAPTPASAAPSGPRRAGGHRKAPSTSVSDAGNSRRALSPSESILSAARAISPVRYFLRPGDASDDYSGEYNSFASLGTDGRNGNASGETSYNYSAEEEYVRAHQNARGASRGPRLSDSGRKKKAARDDDMPYRPGRDDELEDVDEDSEGEGEGIVRQGGLNGRAETRGRRAEKGDGYLGNGLGIQPRQRRSGRKDGEGGTEPQDDESEDEAADKQQYEHNDHSYSQQVLRNGRSPTPAQIIRAALTPRADRSASAPLSRRRVPSSMRTIITNLLHLIPTALRLLVDLLHWILTSAFLQPTRSALASGKGLARRLKRDWWKYVLGLLALSLALRLGERPWRTTASFHAPDIPPSSLEELVTRLTSIEQALSSISAANKALEQHGIEERKAADLVTSRVGEVETVVTNERKRLEIVRVGAERGAQQLQSSLDGIRTEVEHLASRMGSAESGLSRANGRLDKLDDVEREVSALKVRIGAVEQDVHSVLQDGRLRNALENLLPAWMPVRKNDRGTIDIDPVFWTEMKRVLVGHGEVESLIRKAVSGNVQTSGISEKQLGEWAGRFYDAQVKRGDVLPRADFIRILEGEISNLKEAMAELRTRPAPSSAPASSGKKQGPTVSVKSPKGDDLTGALQSLIDAALLRYSKDTIARPDYALFTAGGRVVPSITSDTLVMSAPGTLGRVILGRKPIEGLSPAHALMPDNTVGKCWPFKGDKGQLGVMLSRRVVVSDVTVEHAASEVAVDIRSAPKDIEVWGLIEGAENLEKARKFQEAHSQAEQASMPPSPNYLLLATFNYDPSLPDHVQTFPVNSEIQALGIDMGIIIFKITSNYGGDFTCLYRTRVHGAIDTEAI